MRNELVSVIMNRLTIRQYRFRCLLFLQLLPFFNVCFRLSSLFSTKIIRFERNGTKGNGENDHERDGIEWNGMFKIQDETISMIIDFNELNDR